MAGWCCCDIWEEWDKWQPENHQVAVESLRSQSLRLRSHPSLLVWLYGSDNPPPPDVEREYLNVLKVCLKLLGRSAAGCLMLNSEHYSPGRHYIVMSTPCTASASADPAQQRVIELFDLLAPTPLGKALTPDVEALLIDRGDREAGDTAPLCRLVPVDACYELIGRLRTCWAGFDGGPEARAEFARFMTMVRERSRPLTPTGPG